MAGQGHVTKARLLKQLASLLESARVLPLMIFTVAEWDRDPDGVLRQLETHPWSRCPLAVRSSALREDIIGESGAGRYTSVLSVCGREELVGAIDRVIRSYGEARLGENEVLVQPMLECAQAIGAATTADPTSCGGYRVISWSEDPTPDIITSGLPGRKHHWRGTAAGLKRSPVVERVSACIDEIERLCGYEHFEIEFGIDQAGELVLFQLRRIEAGKRVSAHEFSDLIDQAAAQLAALSQRDKRILGTGTLLGAMSDWNPAEIIGMRPLPLARSLYRHVITDSNWADRRAAYGYRNLRGVPLMIDIAGHALVDLRASFTSFIPASLPGDVAGRLVNSYCEYVRRNPECHDKIEFEVAVTCTSFSATERLASCCEYGLDARDVSRIEQALRNLTETIADPRQITREMNVVEKLAKHRADVAHFPELERALRLVDATSAWGGRAFGGLARCSFVATEILRSAMDAGQVRETDLARFFGSLSLPSKALRDDLAALPRKEFLLRYGHLRPGTYDIRMLRYDEAPNDYFPVQEGETSGDLKSEACGLISEKFVSALDAGFRSLGVALEGPAFVAFARAAIEAREWSKFEFSHSLSDALSAITSWGERLGIERGDLAFLEYKDLSQAAALGTKDVSPFLRDRISDARARVSAESAVVLPVLLRSSDEIRSHFSVADSPTFVSQRRVVARTADVSLGEDPVGAIALIPHGDPGYDWLFSRPIVGLVTAFGGPNSHMAIRALEVGIPAVLGCGANEYGRLAKFRVIELDAGARMVRGVA